MVSAPHFYVFFRLYHVLYERLQRAHELSIRGVRTLSHDAPAAPVRDPVNVFTCFSPSSLPVFFPSNLFSWVNDSVLEFCPIFCVSFFLLLAGPAQDATYARFSRLLFELLHGTLDNARFEDECRQILGAGSFSLFTLDKTVLQLIKVPLSPTHPPSHSPRRDRAFVFTTNDSH